MGKNCNAHPCCVAACKSVEAAILAEADEEYTPTAEVSISDRLRSVPQRDGR